MRLFYRNALRQVARLVDIGRFEDRDMVGQELDRDRIEQRCDERVAGWRRDAESQSVAEPGNAGGGGDHHDAATARHDLLDITERLLEGVVMRRNTVTGTASSISAIGPCFISPRVPGIGHAPTLAEPVVLAALDCFLGGL
jgi:hypothetical protein